TQRLLFFFSSRRRHTRFSRDWSSDVCSSDLTPRQRGRGRGQPLPTGRSVSHASPTPAVPTPASFLKSASSCPARGAGGGATPTRSEERRVGKEYRSARSQEHIKQKQIIKYSD